MRYVNIFLRIFLTSNKLQIELKINLINSQYANLETYAKSHPNWSEKLPDCCQAIQEGVMIQTALLANR
jgi:hypothetical protein